MMTCVETIRRVKYMGKELRIKANLSSKRKMVSRSISGTRFGLTASRSPPKIGLRIDQTTLQVT
jgi:hypothetical protein